MSKKKSLNLPKKLINFSIWFEIVSFPIYLLVFILLNIFLPIIFGLRVKGKKNLKHIKGAIVIFNHCHYLDTPCVAYSLFLRRTYFISDEKIFKTRGLRFIVRALRTFPIPRRNPLAISPYIKKALEKNRLVSIAPEGTLLDYNQELSNFKKGAFYFAYDNNVPIVPISLALKRRKLFGKDITKPFTKITSIIGEPKKINEMGKTKEEAIENAINYFREAMQKKIDLYNGDKTLYKGKIKHTI